MYAHRHFKNGLIVFSTLGAFFSLALFIMPSQAQAATVELEGYAWSDTPQNPRNGEVDLANRGAGWISFNCKNQNACSASNTYKVTVDEATGALSGYAWSEHLGWMAFGASAGSTASVNIQTGVVDGWAKFLVADGNGWDGLVKLRGATQSGQSYGVTYNKTTKEFEGWAWGDNLIGWVSFNCKNQNSCGSSNYQVRADLAVLQPPTAVAVATPACSIIDISFTDNSIGEDFFEIYRGTDATFTNGATRIEVVGSISKDTTGQRYTDIEDSYNGNATFHYHVRAVSDSGRQSDFATSGPVVVKECDPNVVANMNIVKVTRNGSEFDYTPTTKINDLDILTIDVDVSNSKENSSASVTNMVTQLTSNLTVDTSSILISRGGAFEPVSSSYTDNILTVPSSGSLGSITKDDSPWILRFKVEVKSSKTGTDNCFDRFYSSGILTYQHQGNVQIPYMLPDHTLVYLCTDQNAHFQEK